MATRSVLSTEYLVVDVSFQVAGVPQDPTADAVQFAVLAPEVNPGVSDWLLGSWEPGGPPYAARVLIGPGGALAPIKGDYWVWTKISDNPEVPVHVAGFLHVF